MRSSISVLRMKESKRQISTLYRAKIAQEHVSKIPTKVLKTMTQSSAINKPLDSCRLRLQTVYGFRSSL